MEQRLTDRRIASEGIDHPLLQPEARPAEDSPSQVNAYERMETYLAKRETLEDEPAMLTGSIDATDSSS